MDILATASLRAHYLEALRAAETYRDASEKNERLGDFYAALAFTYERMAREANLMLEQIERAAPAMSEAA